VDGLVIPPASTGRMDGSPVEDVVFMRDEMANLVWAVEKLVPGTSGDAVRPTARAAPQPPPSPSQDGERVLSYTVMTDVPPTWIPYLPRLAPENGAGRVELVRGTVRRYHLDGTSNPQRGARILRQAGEHARIASAEVPREGVGSSASPWRGDGAKVPGPPGRRSGFLSGAARGVAASHSTAHSHRPGRPSGELSRFLSHGWIFRSAGADVPRYLSHGRILRRRLSAGGLRSLVDG
jgi:hypothetical protein